MELGLQPGMYSRDLLAEAREGWAYAHQVSRELRLGSQLRSRLGGGLTAAAGGSLLMTFGSGGTTTTERALGAIVFALGIGVGVIVRTRRVQRDVDHALGRVAGSHMQHNTDRISRMVTRLHLCAWLAPLWLVLLPSMLFAVLSACGIRSAATTVAVVAAVQIWVVAACYGWLACPTCCRPIRHGHVSVPPAPEVWLALATSWYTVTAVGSLVLLPLPSSVGERLLFGAPRLGWLSLLLLLPTAVLAVVGARLADSLDDSMTSALLGTVWLPLVRKLGGSLLHCADTSLVCGSQTHIVHVGGTLMSLLILLIAVVHFQAVATTTQSLVLWDPSQLLFTTAGNTLLAFVCGAVEEGHSQYRDVSVSRSSLLATSGRDLAGSAVALLAIVLAVLQLQVRWRRGLPTNLRVLNNAKDAAAVATLLCGLTVLLVPPSWVTLVANFIMAALMVLLVTSACPGRQKTQAACSRRWLPWERLGSGWQQLAQADNELDAARIEDVQIMRDTDLSYHAWLHKKAQAMASSDRRVCFSFAQDAQVGTESCALGLGRVQDHANTTHEEAIDTTEELSRELDTLTISEMLRCEGFRITLLGLDAASISALRLIGEVNKLSSHTADKARLGDRLRAIKTSGQDRVKLIPLQCSFEMVEFACPTGELEPWLDDDIVKVQMAISHHAAHTLHANTPSACQQCKWSYVECHNRKTKNLVLVDIRRSRLSQDAAERMGWAMQVNSTLTSVFLQFTAITGPLATGISSAMNLECLTLLNADIKTDGGAAIGTLCGGVGRRCTKLHIEKSKLTEEGCIALAAGLRNDCGRSQLADVRLIGCRLGRAGSTGPAAIAQALGTCCALKTLFMVDVGMQDTDVVAFAAGVSAKAKLGSSGQHAASSSTGFLMLETLLLHNNEIGDRGVVALAEVLMTCCPNLRMLRLDNNKIGSAGVESLCHSLARAKIGGNLRIQQILLARNPLDINDRAEWLGCCEAMGVATDVQLIEPAASERPYA